MRRSKDEVDRYVSSIQSASPSLKEKPVKGFLFAKLYFEAKEYELAKRYVSAYLTVQERDPKAHKFLGQLFEREGNIDKAVGCYKRSVDLNPAQKDLVLKVAELLCSKPERDSRAEFWLEKAAKLLPGSPAVYNLKEKLLSSQGQQGWNQLFDLLQSELQLRPDNPHINIRLVCLYRSDGRLEEAVNHCLAVEKKGTLRCSLDWYSTVTRTLQDFLNQPSVLSNEKVRRKLQKELLLAQCSLLRLSLAERTVSQCVEALHSFDNTMQETTKLVDGTADELSEAFTEMKGHLYLHAGTLLLKMAHVKEQQWRAVTDLAALCYLLAYRVPKPKGRPSKGERGPPVATESLACDRLSQSGHMLLNLSRENDYFVKEVVEAFGNRSGQGSLFEMLFGTEAPAGPSFIANDDIRSIGAEAPEVADLAKSDTGAIPQHCGDLQQLVWLGLQWALMGRRAALRDWLMKLFPRLTLETSKLDTNTPESICLLDLEVFLCGVVFCSQTQLQETQKISASSQLHEVRCLPLQLIKLLSNERQRDWWNAVYSLLHNRALPGTSAKLRMTVQHGLSTLRAGEKHGLQPALVIHWARHLRETGSGFDSYYDQKEYIGRSVHYWKVVLRLLEKIKKRRSIPEPLDPLFMHFASKDLQISEVKGVEEEVKIAFAILLDIEGKTEEAIATLENINSISASWHLAQIFQRLSEQAGSGVEENQDRCITFLKKFRKYLSMIYTANAAETDKLPVSMENVMDLLEDVNQQLGDSGQDMDEEEEGQSAHSSPNQLAETSAPTSRIKFSTPSPTKNALSPSKRHIFSPPHWAEDQKSILQMLCQQVEALTNEVHDLRHNSSGATASPHHRMYDQGYGAEGLQEPFPAAQSFHGAPLTVATTGPAGPVYYNPSPAYNSQYLLRTTANVTPTKAPVYGMNRLPPQQHMYAYQQPTHTPPLQTNPGCIYPQDQVYGAPLRFESPATMLSPYSEEYYNHGVPQPSTNPPLPEPGYFTKPAAVPMQPPKGNEAKPVEFGKIGFGQQIPVEPPKVPTFGAGVVAQSTPAAASFKFNSNFKSNDGDFTFPSMQIKNSESLLGLLTSDLPPRNEQPIGQTAATQDQGPVSQTGIFNFGVEKAAGFSFADAAQSQSKTGLFGSTDQPFSFTDVTQPVFGAPSAEEQEKPESDGEGARVDEDEDGPHFEPIVPLPDKVDVKTGEEEEEEMFCNRAKLFRFDSETREWKERGIGSVKILRHRTSGKVRLLMRREQVLKICANHYITADMVLKPNAGSDKSWVWYAIDYADEMPKPEQLAIRFKTADEAALFKVKFEEAQKVVPKSPQKQELPVEKEIPPKESSPQTASKDLDFGALFAKKEGEWDCSVCCIRNSPADVKCVACQNPNPTAKSEADGKAGDDVKGFAATGPSARTFTFGFGTNASKDSSSASATQSFGSFSQFPTTIKFGTSDTTSKPIGFGAQFEKKPAQWDCSTCSVRNEASANQCSACQSAKPSSQPVVDSPAISKSSTASFGAGFGSQFLKKEGEWDCSVCCVRNGPTAVKCVACQNPNPTAESEANGKAGEEVKGFAATVPSAGAFTFGFGTNASKDSSSASTTQPFGSFSQFPTTIKFGTSDSTSKPIGFGAQFEKKSGQWDCSTCSVRNEASANQCAACQSLNPSCKSVFDIPAVSKSSTASIGAGFGGQFLKKEGEWDCSACCVRNGPTVVKCVACQNPNPTAESEAEGKSGKEFKGFAATVPSAGNFTFGFGKDAPKDSSSTASTQPFDSFSQFPTTIKFGTSDSVAKSVDFGAQFEKKPGQWDCSTCSVRNEAPANQCISCQAPNPSSKPVFDNPAASKPSIASSGAGFGSQFIKKEGQWDCDTCLVRNEASALKCASCMTPRKIAPNEGLAAMFGKKGGQWDCGTCLVRNAASVSACVSCQTLNPNANVACTSPANAPAPPSSAFTFSIGSLKASDAPATTGVKASFNIGTAFKFGQGEDKGSPASFKFELPQAESKPSSSKGFSFSMPLTAGPFKFGTKEPVKLAAPAEVSSDAGPASICLKNMAEQHREREEKEVVNAGSSQEGTEQEENLLFSGKQNTFTFADLAKSSQGNFQFGQKDPGFSGFSRAGEQLFASLKPSEKQDSAQDQDEEDMYKTEEQDDIQFDPVVQMPEKVDLVTGEEDEEVLYSHRVKLFRFDADTSQWKERGVGNLKILKNNKNGKLRVVMRREQVFKVCANHLITTTMNLKPLSGSDRAWMWLANDFSEGDANLEQLAAKFKTPEMAEEFKLKFEECQRLLLDIPLQTPHKLVDTGRTAHLIQKAEEMKTGLKDLKSFLTDDKAKIKEQGRQVDDTAPNQTLASMNKPHSEACMSLEWDNYDLQEDALDKTAETSVCASILASSPEVRKNLFRFGESTAGFSFSFQPIISPSKSPAKLNQSRASVGTDDESETQEEERDSQYFEPVVPLPDLVEISTGEENELVVFCHRAKLYRYHKELNQWKERGIGDIKILQNKDTKRVRLVMRRDQVLKLCANHWITSTMKVEPMKGAEKAWIWSALDFSEGEGKVEQLAVRFKLLEVANAFKDVFEAAKNAEEGNIVLTPVSTKECTPRKTTCGLAAIAALEETIRERTELPPQSSHDEDSSTSPAADHGQQTPSKTIVSPPKFVFGSDSVQKIFGSPPSSSELMPSIKTSSKDKAASAASPSVKVPESASAVHPFSAAVTPSMPTFKVPTRAASGAIQENAGVGAKADGVVELGESKDLQIVFVREPTVEQEAFARSLLLPRTFFCYQNEPGYVSDDLTDDEDYEAAVRKLNGKLYPDPPEAVTLETGVPEAVTLETGAQETVTRETVVHAAAPVDPLAGERDADCVIVWEKKPTPEEQERAARLQLPPTFFCGVGSDEGEKDKPDDFETELRKAQEDLKRTEESEVADPVVSSSSDAPAAEEQASPQPDSSSEATPAPSCPAQDSTPIDLSTKKGPETEPDSTSQEPTTAFAGFAGFGSLGTLGGFSFADLAKNTSDFAFGNQDANFTWANAGATVFGAAPATQTDGDQPGSDEEEAASSADIHFEPIVSLPEVETKSGEEDEEILFKERAKLFRWDRNLNQWKERGVGDIKILYHPQKRCYRVLMRRDQVLKVCANHTITQGMELVPMNTSNNALVWNATDYAEGSAQIEQLASKFKTAELADSFRKTFEECLSRLSQADSGQMSRALEHSREGNPTVFFCVSADGELLGKIAMELFSHIVPKTAENFRALCTGERGFSFRNSVFHRIIPDFMCQGGDITNQDGTGGKSIYGEKFEDENFDVRHTGPGLLSMANRGRDTNNSQFFITLKKAEHLDFKHVAFGFVKDGMDVVKRMGELGSKSGKPSKKIVITDCGQLQ